MLGYYDPVISDGCTISVDRLSIQFNVIDDLVDMLRTDHYLKGVFPWLNYEDIDTRRYHFRYYYKVTYHSGIMTVMLCHNSNEQCKCRIEVNPNKCFNDPNCIQNIQELLMYSSEYYINQLDVAIDIPKSPDLISFLRISVQAFSTVAVKTTRLNIWERRGTNPVMLRSMTKPRKAIWIIL